MQNKLPPIILARQTRAYCTVMKQTFKSTNSGCLRLYEGCVGFIYVKFECTLGKPQARPAPSTVK